MEKSFYRKTWIEVDLNAIHDNVRNVRQAIAADQAIMAVVKANAYGHGAVQVANEALSAGATWLGVALLEEAIELREAGIGCPILILGYLAEEYLDVAQAYDVSITVPNVEYFKGVLDYLRHPNQRKNENRKRNPLKFHLKIDTGMNRLGLKHEREWVEVIQSYVAYQNEQHSTQPLPLLWEGLFTHLATADNLDSDYIHKQVSVLHSLFDILQQNKIRIPIVHVANSAGIFRQEVLPPVNLVRLGISMYGLYPSAEMKEVIPFTLKPALSLHSKLSLVKKVPAAEGISYGVIYMTNKEEWIGTIPMGYADGWSRELSNQAEVLIEGKRVKSVGRVCMDQMMIQLDKPYPKETKVTLIGSQGNEEITADEVALHLNTINYEITCMLTYRVPRLFVRN